MTKQNAKQKLRSFTKELKKGKIPKDITRNILLYELKYGLTAEEANKILDKLDDVTFDYIISDPLPKSLKEISADLDIISENKLDKELGWASRFLNDYENELNLFLKLQAEYDWNLLSGNYTDAKINLDKIDSQVCISLWSVEQRLLIAELEKGFQANKNLLTTILENNESELLKFIISYFSIRVEKNISRQQYNGFVEKFEIALTNFEIKNYLLFKLHYLKSFNYKNYPIILAVENRFSIIDRYKTYILLAQIIICKYTDSKVLAQLKKTISQLVKSIHDIDLVNLNLIINNKWDEADFDSSYIQILDHFVSSEYDKALSSCRTYIQTNPKSFDIILIYCKSLIYCSKNHEYFNPNGSVIDNICSLCFKILNKDSIPTHESFSELLKIADTFGGHPLSLGLFYFLSQESPYLIKNFSEIDLLKMFLLNSKVIDPSITQYFPLESQSRFITELGKNVPYSTSLNLIKIAVEIFQNKSKDQAYTSVRQLKAIAVIFFVNKKYSEALEYLNSALSSPEVNLNKDLILTSELLLLKIDCLISINSYLHALHLLTDTLIKNENFKHQFYRPNLIQVLIESDENELKSDICTSIYLKINDQFVDPYEIYIAYDNYLCSKGFETPAQLISSSTSVSYSNFEFAFLEKVCRIEVIYSSPYFSDQEELELARIDILNFLALNGKDSPQIQNEISNLFRRILVRKGIKQIDYSKIYVDINGLKSTLQKELKESFIRNIEIASLSLDQINQLQDSIGGILVYYLEKQEEDQTEEDVIKNLKLTSYNRFLHFTDAFLKVRDAFISNKDYGLDTYVSMRIRHGTLLGQIRNVFEAHKLITEWSENINDYQTNEFWINKFSRVTDDEKSLLTKSFNQFSKAIDDITSKLRSQTIQIKTELINSVGLFDYTYSEKDLLNLFSKQFGSIREYDLFIDNVIEELWKKTEHCLNNIKIYLSNEFNNSIEREFQKLEDTINSILSLRDIHNSELHEVISSITTCRTAIVVEIHKISEWFNRSNKRLIDEFDFSILVDSCINTLQSINPILKEAKISINNNCDFKFDGDLFPYFTDIFFYLILNAITHSKLDANNLNIIIDINMSSDYIYIVIKNNIFKDAGYEELLHRRVENTRKVLAQKETSENINKEGGTGYPKIKKTISQDLNRKYYEIDLQLSYEDETLYFIASIKFELNQMKTKTNENINHRG